MSQSNESGQKREEPAATQNIEQPDGQKREEPAGQKREQPDSLPTPPNPPTE